MNKLTQDNINLLQSIIDDCDKAIADARAEIDACVLDGAPYALRCWVEGIGEPLYRGEAYEGMSIKEGTICFRVQRRTDLCGCILQSPRVAKENVNELNAFKDKGERYEAIHRKDHAREQLARYTELKAQMESRIAADNQPRAEEWEPMVPIGFSAQNPKTGEWVVRTK